MSKSPDICTSGERALSTRQSLVGDLAELGVAPGSLLMVHSSLSRIGWVIGGAPIVVRALLDAIGPDGTLVMPAFSPEVSDPAAWREPFFAAECLALVREHVPAFDPDTTPTSMGAIAETFRRWPGVRRSLHPQVSICAKGPLAEAITSRHDLAWGQGAGSPFERLYESDAKLLLLGVGFNRATALHYAESRVSSRRTKLRTIPFDEAGQRVWRQTPDVGDDNGRYFPALGAAYLAERRVAQAKIGQAPSFLLTMRDLVDFAADYLEKALSR